MPFASFTRIRINWGGFDFQHGTNTPYGTAQTLAGGASAAAVGGIGVRRCLIMIDRQTSHASADPAEMHFDFMNITSGAPDDTWITSDFTTLEGFLTTWWATAKVLVPNGHKLTEFRWYRIGPGVTAPNPAERVNTLVTPVAGTAGATMACPQQACSLTFRTAVRRSWGRTYLPAALAPGTADGTLGTGSVDSQCTALSTLMSSSSGADFVPVVYSPTKQSALAIESVEVDNNLDVIRRRRWKQSTYRKVLP